MSLLKTYIQRIQEFGLKYVFLRYVVGRFRGKHYQQMVVLRYLQDRYGSIVENSNFSHEENSDYTIWVCWWQGFDNMPKLVRMCYDSIVAHANGHQVVLITQENYADYVSVDEQIKDKLDCGIISVTHFSDVLRCALLSKYGGLWMDATLYVVQNLPAKLPPFYTIRQTSNKTGSISEEMWTGFCLGGTSGSPIFTNMNRFFSAYWSEHNLQIDYFLIDYFLRLQYEQCGQLSAIFNQVTSSNPQLYKLQSILNDEYNELIWKKYKANNMIFKLNRRIDLLKTENGERKYWEVLMHD